MALARKNVALAGLGVLLVGACFIGGFLLMGKGGEPKNEPAPEAPGKPVVTGVKKEVYRADFSEPPGAEWSLKRVSRTKEGQRPNLGPFYPKDSPSLTLNDLPAHQMLRMTFDLYLTDSWDGSSPEWGPSMFEITLNDERSLIHTTFCNCGFFEDNNEQAFPDNYPAMPFPGFTMAAESQSLGSKHDFGGGADRIIDCSSVYHLVLTFPHDQPLVVFNFQTNIRDGDYKGYGLANMRIEALPAVAALTPEEMAQAWADLGSGVPEVFFKARWDLIAAGDAAVDYLSRHGEEKTEMAAEEKRRLADAMKDPNPEQARAAFFQLRAQGPAALPLMTPALGNTEDVFIKLAASQFERYPATATEMRLERAKAVLDTIHTEAARRLKKALAE